MQGSRLEMQGSRLEIQGSKARGSRLEGSTYRILGLFLRNKVVGWNSVKNVGSR